MKQIKFNLLAIIGMMVAVGTVAFTGRTTLATQWYTITFNDENDELQDLLGTVITDPTQGAECDSTPEEIRCAVLIENPNNLNLSGKTVQAAKDMDPAIDVKEHTYRAD